MISLETLLQESVADATHRERTTFDDLARPFAARLVLFGAGGFGRRTLTGLRVLGIEPLGFADNDEALWGQSVEGVPVLAPADAARQFGDSSACVMTIWNGQAQDRMPERIARASALGFERVMPVGTLFWKYPGAFLPYYPLDLPHKLLLQADNIRRAHDLFTDEPSRAEFEAQVCFRLHLSYESLGSPGPEEHYFPPLFALTSEETLVDCGAFDGDTIRAFLRLQGDRFRRLLAFEPDPLNWPGLQNTLAALPADIREKITAYPHAVSARSGAIQFDSTGTNLSTVGSGALTVPCVTLDDVLCDDSPTMIKFDIEGAELSALLGSAEVIRQHRPVLAVSAYHQQSHLWEIPLLIDRLSPGYRFGLRPHGTEGWDLVCYAIPTARWAHV